MLGTPAFKLTSPTGDVVFESKASAKEVEAELEAVLFVLQPGFETSGWAYSGSQL
jgi:uncharacterized protein (DUF1697 family)